MAHKLKTLEELLAHADTHGMRRALIITALPLELAAVTSQLVHLGSVMANKGAISGVFEVGQFGATGQEWLVVCGESGPEVTPAMQFVTLALQEFSEYKFELMLFVGVAASRKPDDAPLGSVLAAKHIYFPEGGKYIDGLHLARPRMLKADPKLAAYSQSIARGTAWHSRISPSYAGKTPADDEYPKPFPPKATLCAIVTVNSVSADPDSTLEQHIGSSYQDSTGLEMEGYGALAAAELDQVPCIVIRGISDARGGKNPELDKIHQPVAAGHATAFALELIDTWSVNVPAPAPKELPAPSVTPTIAPQNAAGVSIPDAADSSRLCIVVQLPGQASDYPHERQIEILQAIKSITGDFSAELVGNQPGSFYLFISLLQSAWDRLKPGDFSAALSEAIGSQVCGVTTEEEFKASDNVRETLLKASEPLLRWPQTLPDGTSLERPELSSLLAATRMEEGSTTALLGLPGSGKTALLATLAGQLKEERVPFLAIKADMLDTSVANEDDLRTALDLPSLPSLMLTKLSRKGPVVLIIDQLDALAGYLDLLTGRLSALLNLVRRLGGQKHIHIILSARTFEFEHDVRLKSVRAESLQLDLPGWSAVLSVLQAHGIKAEGWPSDAKEELRSPQALATFLSLSRGATTGPIGTYQAMLEKLWQERLLSLPSGARIAKLAAQIAEDMAEKETLWVASARYDENAGDLGVLIGNGILRHHPGDPRSIGFTHQTVFDFALARSFAQKPGQLAAYVLGREASLFVRPKLWSALTYLRGAELPTYESEIQEIWNSPVLRPHLRLLLIEFLGQQATPTGAEASIFDHALSSENRQLALQSIQGSPGWFARLRDREISAAMLNPKESGLATNILIRMAEFVPLDVVGLLERNWAVHETFDANIWAVLQETPKWTERHLSLAKTVLSRTRVAPYAMDHLITSLGVDEPSMAISLVRHRLDLELAEARQEAVRRANLPKPAEDAERLAAYIDNSPSHPLRQLLEQSDGWDGLEALGKNNPRLYLNTLWPWFTELLATLHSYERNDRDRVFPLFQAVDLRLPEESTLDLPEYPITGSLRTALGALAVEDEVEFRTWFSEHEKEEWDPVQHLLADALAVQPKRYASLALEFLLGDTRRFALGNYESLSIATKRLVEAVSPYWSDAQLGEFVGAVVAYSIPPAQWRDAKARQSLLQRTEQTKLELLRSIPNDRTTQSTKSYIELLKRKFGDEEPGARISGPFWIGPSMSADQMRLATDAEIGNAFRELPDKTGWDNPKHWMKGGNVQLARAFAELSKSDPVRAVRIISVLPPHEGTRAAAYALDAMAEEANPSLVIDTFKMLELRGFAGGEYRETAARAIERLIRRDVDVGDDILEILTRWLAHTTDDSAASRLVDGDDATDDSNGHQEDADTDHDESILWGDGGITTLPGGNYPTLETIVRILLKRHDFERLLRILTDHLARKEDERVWEALARFFRYIRPKENHSLIEFINKLFEKYPHLIESREIAIALAYMHWSVPDLVAAVLEIWRKSNKPRLQRTFGELLTLVWLMQPDLTWPKKTIGQIFESSEPHSRAGAAFAAAHVWADNQQAQRSVDLLRRILSMHEPLPFKAALDIFRVADNIESSAEWPKFLDVVADEIALHASFPPTFVIERLQRLLPQEAQLVGRFALALVAKWSSDLADVRTETAMAAADLVDIAITLHRLGPVTREIGTQLFEELVALNAYSARDTLNQIDSRFPDYGRAQRRRLPRRSRVRRKRRGTQAVSR